MAKPLSSPSVVALALLTAILTANVADGHWCGNPSPVCPCACRASIAIPGLGETSVSFSGSMELECSDGVDFGGGLLEDIVVTTGFEVVGCDPVLGEIRAELDTSRPQPSGTMTNLLPGQEFPREHDFFAHVTISIEALPGVELRSIGPFEMVSVAANSFDPSVDEPYSLALPVEFEDVEAPGIVAAVVTSSEITVNETDAPLCEISGFDFGPPFAIEVTAQDSGSGIESVDVLIANNMTVDIPPFPCETTEPLFITASVIDPTARGQFLVRVTDHTGNSVVCDPHLLELSVEDGVPTSERLHDVPSAERWLTVQNGSVGVDRVRVAVNDTPFRVLELLSNEQKTIDLAPALRDDDTNTVEIVAEAASMGSALLLLSDIPNGTPPTHGTFVRGDANDDGNVDLSDAVCLLGYLFLGTCSIRCMDSADVNDRAVIAAQPIDISDAVFLLAGLFLGGRTPPPPFANCGVDPTTDVLGCNSSRHCP